MRNIFKKENITLLLSEDFLQEFQGFLFNPHFALNYLLETLSGLVPLKENQPDLEDIDDEDLDLEDLDNLDNLD